jgi:hydroxypyruvate reductase
MIRNREALVGHGNHEARETLLDAAATAIDAIHPRNTVPAAVDRDGDRLRVGDRTYDLGSVGDVYVVGAGKGAAAVTAELAAILGDRIDGGVVAEKDGGRDDGVADPIEVVAAGHPIPDGASLSAGERALSAADAAGPDDLVLVPVTGGASATLAAPAGDLTLDDLAATTRTLLNAGLRIDEINAVRKHCSAIKGGRLAERITPATAVTLVVVDEVAGEPWGPTVGDATTFANALDVLARHGLTDAVSPAVVRHLERGRDGGVAETPTETDAPAVVLAGPVDAAEAAADRVAALDHEPLILSTTIEGESREVATCLAAVADEAATYGRPAVPPCVLISGGETTVRVNDSDGEGGPNQEFALSFALELDDDDAVTTLALGTDGTDGPTDAAGGLVDATTVPRMAEQGIDAHDHLRRHDATPALRAVDDAVITGPTGTNVMDLRLTLVED